VPRLVDVGAGVGGGTRRGSGTGTDWADRAGQLFCGTAGCSWTRLHDLPLAIPAPGARPASVGERPPRAAGPVTPEAAFLIDAGGLRQLDFRLTGEITRKMVSGR